MLGSRSRSNVGENIDPAILGLRSRSHVTEDLNATLREIERLTSRASALRKELSLSGSDAEINAILDDQPIGTVLLDGTPAEPEEILQERLDTDFVSLHHASEVTDTYRNLRASLKVEDSKVALAAYGDGSMTAIQVMRKLYASETLRKLLPYKNDNIGKFLFIDSHGYISIIR